MTSPDDLVPVEPQFAINLIKITMGGDTYVRGWTPLPASVFDKVAALLTELAGESTAEVVEPTEKMMERGKQYQEEATILRNDCPCEECGRKREDLS